MLCPSLRISGHLPAPVVNGGGDRFWKWKEFKLWRVRDLDLDLRSGHMAYRPAAVIDLYLYTKFHLNWRNFLWTDVRTDVRTGGRTFFPSILLGRLSEVDLIIVTVITTSSCRAMHDEPHSWQCFSLSTFTVECWCCLTTIARCCHLLLSCVLHAVWCQSV